MNQEKIGRFIAETRKAKKLTQKQLAEKLCISDKTVSKWECGKGLPEVSLMLPLCSQLDITVNDLLSGERVSETDYKKKAEENMMNLVHEAQESRKKIVLSSMTAGITVLASITMIAVSANIETETWARVILIAVAVITFVVGGAVTCILDVNAGAFECAECKHRFVPEYTAYIMGVHTITRRKLKCPKCHKSTLCKHVLTK